MTLSRKFSAVAGRLSATVRAAIARMVREDMTISMHEVRRPAGDWFGKVGPRIVMGRNWVINLRKRSIPAFAKPF